MRRILLILAMLSPLFRNILYTCIQFTTCRYVCPTMPPALGNSDCIFDSQKYSHLVIISRALESYPRLRTVWFGPRCQVLPRTSTLYKISVLRVAPKQIWEGRRILPATVSQLHTKLPPTSNHSRFTLLVLKLIYLIFLGPPIATV